MYDLQHVPVPARHVRHVPSEAYLDSHGLPYSAFVMFVKVWVNPRCCLSGRRL